MSLELNLDAIKGAKTADYLKAFKNKPFWKNKAQYAVFMAGYKLDKKAMIALPFKKDIEAKEAFKRIKKEKIHALNKVAIGSIVYKEAENCFEFTINGGAADPTKLETAGTKLFEKMKVSFRVKMGEIDPEMQVLASEIAPDADNEPEDELEDVPFDWTAIAEEGSALFTEAQGFLAQPTADKVEPLHKSISTFLADYEVALNDSGDVPPSPALIKQYTQLKGLLQKLEAKRNRPKNKLNEAVAALVQEYGQLFKEVRDEILPLLKENPQAVLSTTHSDKAHKALLLLKNLRSEFPKADAAIQHKLADFMKGLDVHEPQLKGIVARVQKSVGKAVEAARAQMQAQRQKWEALQAQLSPEAKALLGV